MKIPYIKNNGDYSYYIIFGFYLTVLIGFYLNEDSLGSGYHDYSFHNQWVENFKNNFYLTYKNFGLYVGSPRNSPVFLIILSFISKFLDENTIRLLNSTVSICIAIVFFKCLLIKFKEININILSLIASSVYLSPSIRTESIWPYPLIWAFLFFLLSIYFYLLFNNSQNKNIKFKYSILNLIFLSISSYITPTYCVFIFFYFYNFFKVFNYSKEISYFLLIGLILSIPAIFFLITKGVYFTKFGVFGVSLGTMLNPFNKIIIINTIFFYYFLSIANVKEIINIFFSKINIRIFIYIFFFSIISISFFNFDDGNFAGGGFFYKFSKIFLDNNFLLYVVFIISNFVIYLIFFKNINNIILFSTLIFYNLQFSIYNKYFEPLIIVLLFLLFEFKIIQSFFNKKNYLTKFYFFIILYFLASAFKDYFYKFIN